MISKITVASKQEQLSTSGGQRAVGTAPSGGRACEMNQIMDCESFIQMGSTARSPPQAATSLSVWSSPEPLAVRFLRLLQVGSCVFGFTVSL